MADRERRIQEIAYLLWEGEGRPDGQAERFWHMAEAAVDAENELGGGEQAGTATTEATTVLADVSFAEADVPPADASAAKKRATKAKADDAEAKANAAKAKGGKAKADEAPTIAKVAEPEPAIKSAAKPKGRK